MAKKNNRNFLNSIFKITLLILLIINFYLLFNIKRDIELIETDVNIDLSSLEDDVDLIKDEVSSISLYDIESNVSDIYFLIQDFENSLDEIISTIQDIESDVNSIKDNIGGEYDYGTILYKLREIEDK